MNTKIIIFTLLIIPTLSFSQKEKKISDRKERQYDAKTQIVELHDGALLVRLKTKKKSIDALRERGKSDFADKIEQKQQIRNLAIVSAFRSNFSFCPIYFFRSEDLKFVRKNTLDSVSFLNNNLEFDHLIKVKELKFFTAEFGRIEPSKTPTYESIPYAPSKVKPLTYNGSSDFSFKALCIKDDQFNQLRKPFPYYIKESKQINLQKRLNATVRKLEQKLITYYDKKK